MASLGSSIRSAARATFSAYRSVPIRWRLAGGSAALTLVILAGFASIVGVLTDRQVTRQFVGEMSTAVDQLQTQLHPEFIDGALQCNQRLLTDFGNEVGAQIRLLDDDGDVLCTQKQNLTPREMSRLQPRFSSPVLPGSYNDHGYRVQASEIGWSPSGEGWLIYARPLSGLDETIAKVRFFLLLGVLGGTVFALLAGLATAQRAMRPIAQLSDAAREIERTRDPTLHIPHPAADDEVAELARTLEGMLGALGAARGETESALQRQREFVADASHELRTPLTSVLANLELLADELTGEQADSAKAALRSTRRMRRLVGDLLLLARADVERQQPLRPTDLAAVLTDAASELGPVAEDHELTVDPQPARIDGTRDDLHRLTLNLLENAVRHTPPGTHIRARTGIVDGVPTLVVEDDGPGIPPELRSRVFERFVRGGGDTAGGSRGTGLGLAIVRAVADSHEAVVALEALQDGVGTRFVIRFPISAEPDSRPPAPAPGEDLDLQTSTTTGNTIGRRRNRS
jgi:two-component system, OmpR family, sensor kinase